MKHWMVLLVGIVGCGGAEFTADLPQTTDAGGGGADAGASCDECGKVADGGWLMVDASCCGSSCLVEHQSCGGRNGFGSAQFYDCIPLGSWNVQLAMEACFVYFGPGKCAPAACTGDAGVVQVVQGQSAACISFAYGGDPNAVGHWREGDVGGPCVCPGPNDGTWY